MTTHDKNFSSVGEADFESSLLVMKFLSLYTWRANDITTVQTQDEYLQTYSYT